MRTFLIAIAVALTFSPAVPAAAQTAPAAMKLSSGWTARVDDHNSDPDAIKAEPERGGLHVFPGPAALFDRGISVNNKFVVAVRFTAPRQTGPTTPTGGYGIFIGGADLDTPAHRFTALMIRENGEYAVVRHTGGELRYIVDWKRHAALPGSAPLPPSFHVEPPPPDAPERPERRRDGEGGGMGILMQVDVAEGDVRLLVNGAEIASVGAADVDTDGVVGIRVRADTDISFSNFDVIGSRR